MATSLRITKSALATYLQYAEAGRLVVIDTETTGLSRADEVVQIAAIEYVNGRETRAFNTFVCPSCPISPGAEAVHHLSRAFLKKNGCAPAEALARFYAFLGDDALVVGHNLRFDLNMIRGECDKFGRPRESANLRFCDTLALAKKLVPGQAHYRLGYLIESLKLTGVNNHCAQDDARACAALFFFLMTQVPRPGEYIYTPVDETDSSI